MAADKSIQAFLKNISSACKIAILMKYAIQDKHKASETPSNTVRLDPIQYRSVKGKTFSVPW